MIGVIAFLCGVGFGVAASAILWLVVQETRPRALPPATPRALARVRRRNRADIRAALARAGIKLHEPVESPHDKRQWIPLSEGSFDDDQETK